nr:beta-lactamase family protein [Granulosicoccus sp.]
PDCPVAALYRESKLAEDGSRSLAKLAKLLGEFPAVFVPGTRWQYSYATDVLAHCMEVACDKPLDQILHELILKPLGMNETDFHVNPADMDRLMPVYGAQSLSDIMSPPEGEQTLKLTNVEPSYPASAKGQFRRGGLGLFSTTRDYLRFAECLHSGKTADGKRLLSTPMFNLMWANRLPASQMPLGIGPNIYPGYGWNLFGRVMLDVGQAMSLTSNGEGGWAGAAATYFWVDPAQQMTGVVMTQYLGSALPMSGEMRAAAYSMLDKYQ